MSMIPDHGARRYQSFLLRSLKGLANTLLARFGFELRRVAESQISTHIRTTEALGVAYKENPEAGSVNWAEKQARVAAGGPLEWPNIVALNMAVVTLLDSAKRIVELGGGTGCFAFEATVDPERFVVCSELDNEALNWAREHRTRPGIHYIDRYPVPEDGPFDAVVAVDVIEHVADYRAFLKTCVNLAPKAILTTPNKNRDELSSHASPPIYRLHVREWTAGEFFWVLRAFYGSVRLYCMPDVYTPRIVPMSITDQGTPLIAVCELPYQSDDAQRREDERRLPSAA